MLGLLYAAPSLGAVLAGITISWIEGKDQGKILFTSSLLFAFASIVFGVSRNFALSLFALLLMGAGDAISNVIRNTIRQLVTPSRLQGRISSVAMIFFLGGPFLGDAEAGFVAGIVGAPISVILGGLASVGVILGVALTNPKLRGYKESELIQRKIT